MDSEFFLRIFNSSSSSLLVVNEHRYIIHANLASKVLFGYNQLEGGVIDDLIALPFRKDCTNAISSMIGKKINQIFLPAKEALGIRFDGSFFPIELTFNCIPYRGRAFVAASISDRTISKGTETDLKYKVCQLLIKKRQLEEFSTSIIENLETSLSDLSDSLSQISKHTNIEIKESTSATLHDIRVRCEKVNFLISQILTFHQAATDKFLRKIETSTVVKMVLRSLNNKIVCNKVSMVVEELPKIKCYPSLLIYLISCIIEYLIQYDKTSSLQYVEISYTNLSKEFAFFFKHYGLGQHSTLKLKPSLRESYSVSSNPPLGISLCKRIVELHGGDIWLEPNEKFGTTICFTINKNFDQFEN